MLQFYSVNLKTINYLSAMNYYSPGTIYYLHDYFLKIKYTAKIKNKNPMK